VAAEQGSAANDPPTHLLYLHGFRSSPQSKKARQFGDWMRTHRPRVQWWCPQLPPSPRDAVALLEAGCADWPKASTAVIGSSLGGFYATVLAQRWGARAVLLNPAVHPARDLAQHIGQTQAWHSDEVFFFRPEFIAELQDLTPMALEPSVISKPQRYFVVIAKGDEVLDWREMRDRYAGCAMRLIDGGDHALTEFDGLLLEALDFLGLRDRAR
jgi:uncharacterized protein